MNKNILKSRMSRTNKHTVEIKLNNTKKPPYNCVRDILQLLQRTLHKKK